MKINRFKISVWLGALSLVLALSLGSCIKEPQKLWVPGADGIKVKVNFSQSVASKATTIGTEVGTPDENRLDSVTILVFNADGSKLETALSVDVTAENIDVTHPKWKSNKTLMVSPVNKSGFKKIYAIANWGKTEFNKATYTEALLKKELTTIAAVADMNGSEAYPMLMSGSTEAIKLGTTPVTVDMARQAAKIKAVVTLKHDVQNNFPDIKWQTNLMKITVAKIPNKSYVISSGASPAGIKLLNSAEITVEDNNEAQQVPAIKDFTWSHRIYITENPIVGKEQENATYILVQLPYINTATNTIVDDNYYKLLLNDKSDADSPHKVLRNTIYNLNINIIGMGLPLFGIITDVNVENVLTVNDWEDGEIIEVDDSQKYFNIDRTSMVLQMDGKFATSTIATDVADWKLIDAAGKTLLSFAENKTGPITVNNIIYKLSGSATTATITVVKDETSTGAHVQKMYVIAKNLKVPFTVTLDNGFIPNSVLLAQGWPKDILPTDGGLQLAKRGIKVLPSGVAGVDPTMPLKTTQAATICVESVATLEDARFGMGKGSTDAMTKRAADVAEHPAAKYCRDMGPEWYVPSVAELDLIDKNRDILGESYKFPTNVSYWSATQNGHITTLGDSSPKESWTMLFNEQGASTTASSSKNNTTVSLRCVKGDIPPPAGSFIPNSVLLAKGWPVGRLPKTGLQLATRGVQRLPGAVAVPHYYYEGPTSESFESGAQWKTINNATPGVESMLRVEYIENIEGLVNVGVGKSNTDVMIKAGEDLHPVAKHCRQMGPEWYLPSIAELKLLMDYEILGGPPTSSTLGQAYRFDVFGGYLTSTQIENETRLVWTLSLQVDWITLWSTSKDNYSAFRCVREI